MAKIGCLKPFRGTASSLANVVLESGEVVFEVPEAGIGTGYGGIKMGDGTTKFSSLPYFLLSGKTAINFNYDTGTTEAALLNNLKKVEAETLGKIYYLQAYYHNSSQYTEGTPVVSQDMPYMVIGVNREGTEDTMDLASLVPADYRKYSDSYNSWSYGKYSTCKFYSWLANTCPNGYSANIQACMKYMTETWREATGNATGIKSTRQTKCKLLNPVEMFGYSSATYDPGWEYASSSDHKTTFNSNYGSVYPVWNDSIAALSKRRIFHDKAMSTPSYSWLNSWLAFGSAGSYARCFVVGTDGSCSYRYVNSAHGVAPVIRLSLS